MKSRNLSFTNINETNISLTAYRALYVLSLLMERPYTRNELVEKLRDNSITSKSFSLDTLRVTINTLKYAGCIISRPTLRNNYSYVLLFHPFCLGFTESEIETLNKIRENITKLGDWKVIFDINNFYNRVMSKTNNEKNIEKIKNAEPFVNINTDISKFLSKSSIRNKEMTLIYDSVNNGSNEIRVIVDNVFFQDGRLYLWCYSYKYENYSYLRLDKIKAIKNISLEEREIPKHSYLARYIVTGDSTIGFKPKDFETIIEQTGTKIIVEANVLNEFNFIQHLFGLGVDFHIISPDSLKKTLISKLNLMMQGYQS